MKWEFLYTSDFVLKENTSDFEFKKHNALDFEVKLLLHARFRSGKIQRIRCRDENFVHVKVCIEKLKHGFLNLRYFVMSENKKVCLQKSTFRSFTPWKRQILIFRVFFQNHNVKIFFTTRQILNRKGYNESQFESKGNNASDFELKNTARQSLK